MYSDSGESEFYLNDFKDFKISLKLSDSRWENVADVSAISSEYKMW